MFWKLNKHVKTCHIQPVLNPLEPNMLIVPSEYDQQEIFCIMVLRDKLLTCIYFYCRRYFSSQIISRIGENCWCEGNNISRKYFFCWNIVLYVLFFNRLLAVIRTMVWNLIRILFIWMIWKIPYLIKFLTLILIDNF